MPSLHEIKIGCCGWSYEDWKGVLYPADARAGEFLGLYAQHFDIVEVDSTFYRIPSRRTVEGWAERTPDHFRFTLKLPQIITHEKMLRDCDEDLEAFLSVARLLGEKLQCVCLQFGYFNRETFPSLRAFLDLLEPFLDRWPRDIAAAVEIRNRAWLGREWADCLRRHNAAMVLVEQSWMPSPSQITQKLDAATGPFGYVRLLGDRKAIEKITTTWNKIVIDRSDELGRVAEAIRRMARSLAVAVFANNHYAGYAPATVETLRQLVSVPPNTTKGPD